MKTHNTTYLNEELAHLHKRHRLSEAEILPRAEPEIVGRLHLLQLLWAGLQPPLRAEDVGVGSPQALLPTDPVHALADLGTFRQYVPLDGITTFRHFLTEEPRRRWPDAQCLAHGSLEVEKRLCV